MAALVALQVALAASAADAALDDAPVSSPMTDPASFLQTVDDLVPIGPRPAMNVQAGDQTGVVFREVVFQVVVAPAAFREDSRARDQAAVAVVDTEM